MRREVALTVIPSSSIRAYKLMQVFLEEKDTRHKKMTDGRVT